MYDNGVVLVLIVAARWMSLSMEILLGGWKQIAIAQEEVGIVHGIKWERVFRRILLPQMLPALAAAFILTFVFAFNELTLVTLLAPPGISTMPLRIFQTVHYGSTQLLASVCLWQVIFLSFPIALLFALGRSSPVGRCLDYVIS